MLERAEGPSAAGSGGRSFRDGDGHEEEEEAAEEPREPAQREEGEAALRGHVDAVDRAGLQDEVAPAVRLLRREHGQGLGRALPVVRPDGRRRRRGRRGRVVLRGVRLEGPPAEEARGPRAHRCAEPSRRQDRGAPHLRALPRAARPARARDAVPRARRALLRPQVAAVLLLQHEGAARASSSSSVAPTPPPPPLVAPTPLSPLPPPRISLGVLSPALLSSSNDDAPPPPRAPRRAQNGDLVAPAHLPAARDPQAAALVRRVPRGACRGSCAAARRVLL